MKARIPWLIAALCVASAVFFVRRPSVAMSLSDIPREIEFIVPETENRPKYTAKFRVIQVVEDGRAYDVQPASENAKPVSLLIKWSGRKVMAICEPN